MKEYKEAKKILDQKYAEAKKELADQIRPLFHEKFAEFFKAYPEVQSVSWENRTDIFNDEGYEDGIESLRFNLDPDLVTEDAQDELDDYLWEDAAHFLKSRDWLEDNGMLDKFTSYERAKEVAKAGEAICDMVYSMGIEFLQTVFGDYCDVKVTKEGFTVE